MTNSSFGRRARRLLVVIAGVSGLALTPIVLVRAYYEAPAPRAADEGDAPPAAEIIEGAGFEFAGGAGPGSKVVEHDGARTQRAIQRSFPQRVGTPKRIGFVWPVRNAASITSPYGPRGRGFHHGVDIGCTPAEAIRATFAGRVIYAGQARVYGNVVALDHGSGYMTVYAHLSRIDVALGRSIAQGEAVGMCGSTGNSTGPHLHFELRYGRTVYDPVTFLP